MQISNRRVSLMVATTCLALMSAKAEAQTAPNCKTYFPQFKSLDDLNLTAGTFTQQSYQTNILNIHNSFESGSFDKSKCAEALKSMNDGNTEYQNNINQLRNGVEFAKKIWKMLMLL